jgi:hypothetical protein
VTIPGLGPPEPPRPPQRRPWAQVVAVLAVLAVGLGVLGVSCLAMPATPTVAVPEDHRPGAGRAAARAAHHRRADLRADLDAAARAAHHAHGAGSARDTTGPAHGHR